MTWYLVAFEREGDAFLFEKPLPSSLPDSVVIDLVGDHPNLHADCFAVPDEGAKRLFELAGSEAPAGEFDYFIEFRR